MKKTLTDFISEAKQVHGDKYDYSKFVYVNSHTKGTVICPIHGEFKIEPKLHIHEKRGCKYCSRDSLSKKYSMGKDVFIEKAKKVHGDKYNYSKVEYVNNKTKVCIICPEHGEFWQTPNEHLSGRGCYFCGLEKNSNSKMITTDEWIRRARKVHGDKYDYSKVVYVDAKTKVCIICPEHGEFWQIAYCHLQGKGCPLCNESNLEREIRVMLNEKNVKFIQYCKNDTLPFLKKLTLDFYLPDYNIAIECQGEEHFKPIKYFGGEEKYKKVVSRDNNKKIICDNNNLELMYYSNLGIKYPYCVYEDKNKLLETILKNEKNN